MHTRRTGDTVASCAQLHHGFADWCRFVQFLGANNERRHTVQVGATDEKANIVRVGDRAAHHRIKLMVAEAVKRRLETLHQSYEIGRPYHLLGQVCLPIRKPAFASMRRWASSPGSQFRSPS